LGRWSGRLIPEGPRAPPSALDVLKTAGLDAVAVANNHILDYDTENFLETLNYLDEGDIRYVGGGTTLAKARQPVVLEAKGVRIAFLAYSEFADLFFDWDYPRSFSATETVPGIVGIDDHWLAEDIRSAHAQADLVAIAFHWGEEFQNYPTDEQRRLARLSIDLGADLVLGYHPHAIQGFEIYRDRFIAYSTGNFVMDRQDTDLARESMLLDFELSSAGVRSVTVHPVWIEAEQPQILRGERWEQLLDKMREISGWRRP
jgi:poly-gamma-glutamate capsule biosynthesis protein CapA/YwtB (metallophosphatase superfamily)